MASAEQDLESFVRFVQSWPSGREASLDELFDLWRLANPLEAAQAEDEAAIAASLEDFDRGERGQPAGG